MNAAYKCNTVCDSVGFSLADDCLSFFDVGQIAVAASSASPGQHFRPSAPPPDLQPPIEVSWILVFSVKSMVNATFCPSVQLVYRWSPEPRRRFPLAANTLAATARAIWPAASGRQLR